VQYVAGLHEPAVLEWLSAHLRTGGVFYDVGAHIGFTSLVAATLVGNDGQVYAFEADPGNCSRIADHIRINNLPRIELVPMAAWSECKSVHFHRAAEQSSRNMGSVIEEPNCIPDELVRVEAITLDSFAEAHRRPAIVKIDVEGGEEDVLKGADRTFCSAKPLLICEIHHSQAAAAVPEWLASRGYSCRWLGAERGYPRHLVARCDLKGINW